METNRYKTHRSVKTVCVSRGQLTQMYTSASYKELLSIIRHDARCAYRRFSSKMPYTQDAWTLPLFSLCSTCNWLLRAGILVLIRPWTLSGTRIPCRNRNLLISRNRTRLRRQTLRHDDSTLIMCGV